MKRRETLHGAGAGAGANAVPDSATALEYQSASAREQISGLRRDGLVQLTRLAPHLRSLILASFGGQALFS